MKNTCNISVTVSCEDADKVYITFPDGLRLIFKGGEYVGWYVCGVRVDGNGSI